MRAFFYAELLKHFGGVPLLDKTLHFGSSDLKEAKRATFSECVEYILKECDDAIAIFRSVNQDWASNNFGRANDGVALALKGKVLTMAASPLFNRPDNYPQYDSEDSNKAFWRYPNYDKERWNNAAKALKAVIDLGRYDLYKKTNGTKSSYETYFVTRNTVEESIFPFLKGPTIDIYYQNLPLTSCWFVEREVRYAIICLHKIWLLLTKWLMECYQNRKVPDFVRCIRFRGVILVWMLRYGTMRLLFVI